MSKVSFFFILLFSLVIAIGSGFTSRTAIAREKSKAFAADTTINNLFILEDEKSIHTFYNGEFELQPESEKAEFPVVYFSNIKANQYLAAYKYYGDLQDQFSVFEVGYTDSSFAAARLIKTQHDYFTTENKIVLGMTKQKLIEKKGNDFVANKKEDIDVLRYAITDISNSLLKRHHLPAYFAEYYIRNNILVKFKFGFEYP